MDGNRSSEQELKRLTEEAYWNQVWANDALPEESSAKSMGGLRRLLGPQRVEQLKAALASYDDEVLWKGLLERYLPKRPGASVVEIGSAPGTFLVKMAEVFGYEPFGIEYTEVGTQMNRETFRRAGIPEKNVVHADFFSDELMRDHANSYDIVMSRGFVEHFDDVASVVSRHVDLVRPGGHLVVAIPRFRGVYGAWMRAFDREDLMRHNLEIMKKEVFTQATSDARLESLYCGYFGGVQLKRFVLNQPHPAARIYDMLVKRSSMLLDGVHRLVLRAPGLESETFSPYLIYIGRRRA